MDCKVYTRKRRYGFGCFRRLAVGCLHDETAGKKDIDKRLHESQGVPTWLVSYNDRSCPGIDTMKAMIEPYRNVKIERKTYSAGRGGKGGVAGSILGMAG